MDQKKSDMSAMLLSHPSGCGKQNLEKTNGYLIAYLMGKDAEHKAIGRSQAVQPSFPHRVIHSFRG